MNRPQLRRVGVGIAVVTMLALGSLELFQFGLGAQFAVGLSMARAVPLLIYRRYPYVAWWVALGSCFAVTEVMLYSYATSWVFSPWPISSVVVLVAMAGVIGARGDRRRTAGALVAVSALGGVCVWMLSNPAAVLNTAICSALCLVAAVLGDTVHGRRRVAGELAEEKQVSAAERARRSLVEERARIARELHDIVAHYMSMITVQAETARYRLVDLPEPAAEEFSGIAKLARGSLTELRGLLSALRNEQDAPELAPQPTLADLDELVERITAAGTPVRLEVTGDLARLPEVLQLCAYRIVQEALSNVVRHAGGASTTVAIAVDRELTLAVENERAARTPRPPGVGHGLAGLHERTTLLGGTLEVDAPDGGWRVRATLPIRVGQP